MIDRGHAGVELALAVGLLLLPVAIVVMSFGPWSEARVDAEAMAAEAARSAVIDLNQASGAATTRALATSLGYPEQSLRFGWCGAVPNVSGAGSCSFERGSSVDVVIELWTPLLATPWGEVGGIWVDASHSEPIDIYRSLD